MCLYNIKDYKNAIICFDKAIGANLGNEEVYFKKGMSEFYVNNYALCVTDLSKAIALNDNNFTAKKVKETASRKMNGSNKNKDVVASIQ